MENEIYSSGGNPTWTNLVEQKKIRVQSGPKPKIGFHVCIPLYHGIPKEFQTGWTRMGAHGVQEWDNTTDIETMLKHIPHPERFDRRLYCGTCGRIMVKGRNQTINPIDEAKTIKLL